MRAGDDVTIGGDCLMCVWCVSLFVVKVAYEPLEYGRIGFEVDGVE